MSFLCLCVFGNIQCFFSRPVVMSDGYFQRCSLSGALGQVQVLIFLLPACMYICLNACLTFSISESLPFLPDRKLVEVPRSRFWSRAALCAIYTPSLQSHSLDKTFRIPLWKLFQFERTRVCLPPFSRTASLSVHVTGIDGGNTRI